MTADQGISRNSNVQIKHFSKGDIIQRKGDSGKYAYYVKKGLLRSYLIDSKGKEHIFMFAAEGWIIADIEALEYHHPSNLFIDCLEDSEILILDRDNEITDLSDEAIREKFKQLYRRLGVLQRRVIMQMSAAAISRYEYFLETYPDLPQRVPQHMIASYLGITPQALSTIRRERPKNDG